MNIVNSQETLVGDDFSPAHSYEKFEDEKVDFPSYSQPIPTFAASYDEPEEPTPAHLPTGARILGPRFFNQGNLSPESPASSFQKGHLARQESNSSQRSGSSMAWSLNSDESSQTTKGKRWVIE